MHKEKQIWKCQGNCGVAVATSSSVCSSCITRRYRKIAGVCIEGCGRKAEGGNSKCNACTLRAAVGAVTGRGSSTSGFNPVMWKCRAGCGTDVVTPATLCLSCAVKRRQKIRQDWPVLTEEEKIQPPAWAGVESVGSDSKKGGLGMVKFLTGLAAGCGLFSFICSVVIPFEKNVDKFNQEWRGAHVRFKLGGEGYVSQTEYASSKLTVRYVGKDNGIYTADYYAWEVEKIEDKQSWR